MKIDKSRLEALAALQDDALWEKIRNMAAENGLKLPDNTPTHEELEKLRRVLMGDARINMMSAMRMINDLKRGK